MLLREGAIPLLNGTLIGTAQSRSVCVESEFGCDAVSNQHMHHCYYRTIACGWSS